MQPLERFLSQYKSPRQVQPPTSCQQWKTTEVNGDTTSPPHFRLIYFDSKGIGEPIRLILAYAGQQFQDVRLNMDEWLEKKTYTRFGQLPVLEVDGKPLNQSLAILHYLAEIFDLRSSSPWGRAIEDELGVSWYDVCVKLVVLRDETDPNKKRAIYRELLKDFIYPRLEVYDRYLTDSKSGFFGNDKVCWVDFLLYSMLEMCTAWMGINLKPYPNVRTFLRKFESIPQISKWQRTNHKPVSKPFKLPNFGMQL